MLKLDNLAWSNNQDDIRLQFLIRIASLKHNQTTPKLLNNHRIAQAKHGLALEYDDRLYDQPIDQLEIIWKREDV